MGQILSLDCLIYSKNRIDEEDAGKAFLNRLNELLSKDKKMQEWCIVVEVMRDNTFDDTE